MVGKNCAGAPRAAVASAVCILAGLGLSAWVCVKQPMPAGLAALVVGPWVFCVALLAARRRSAGVAAGVVLMLCLEAFCCVDTFVFPTSSTAALIYLVKPFLQLLVCLPMGALVAALVRRTCSLIVPMAASIRGRMMHDNDLAKRRDPRRQPSWTEERNMPVDAKYKTTATASGGGRDGKAVLADGTMALQLTIPKELGGPGGDGANPEKLFALGYSACFLGALRVAATQLKRKLPDETTVTATIGIGPRSEGGFGITAALDVLLPGMPGAEARELVDTTHGICPYSNAIKASVDVATTTRAA